MTSIFRNHSRVARLLLLGAGIVAALSAWLLHFAPEVLLGVEADQFGFALIWPVVLLGLAGLSLLPVGSIVPAVTLGEKRAWISLAVVGLAGAYLFATLQAEGWQIDPRGRTLSRVVSHVVLLWVVASILLRVLRRREAGTAVEDERDAAIRQRAARVGHTALVGLVAAFAVILGFGLVDWAPWHARPVLAQTLIGLLMLSEAVRHAAEIRLYRQDRAT